MRYKILFILFFLSFFVFFLSSCNDNDSGRNNSISGDSSKIASGKIIFEKNCAACHSFRQDEIGPALSGITTEASVEWLHRFIKDPAKMIASGDKRTSELRKRFKVAMPSFAAMSDDDINSVIAFLNTHKSRSLSPAEEDDKRITDPLPEKIKLSDLVVNLELVTQFPLSSDSGKIPLTRITKLDYEPESGILFVNDLRGKLYKIVHGGPKVYLDLKKMFPGFIDAPGLATGFGSFAFHPDFVKNGIFYTTHTEAPGSGKTDFSYADSIKVTVQWVLTEWKTENGAANRFVGTKRELMRINMVTGAHGMQEITFNPFAKPSGKDYGLLYVGVGDGASVQEGYSFIAHSKERVWGTILRINPSGRNSANGKYGIPVDNPFVHDKDPKTIKEIYAYGFRNPHRITWTSLGQMLVSNIGQANIEAIDWVKPGNDYGWPIREGQFLSNPKGNLNNVYPLPANDSIYKITYPVAQYDHDEGNAITGGYEYIGSAVPELKEKFLFGDIPFGRLFYINVRDIKQGSLAAIEEWRITINGVSKTLKQACDGDRVDLRFGRDKKGELYVLTKADGRLYRIGATKE